MERLVVIGGDAAGTPGIVAARPADCTHPAAASGSGMDVGLQHEVVGNDPAAGVMHVVGHDAGRVARTLRPPDDLDRASHRRTPTCPPARLPGVVDNGIDGVHTLSEAQALQHSLAIHRPWTVVMVGGGYIGLEDAEGLRSRGARGHLRGDAPRSRGRTRTWAHGSAMC